MTNVESKQPLFTFDIELSCQAVDVPSTNHNTAADSTD